MITSLPRFLFLFLALPFPVNTYVSLFKGLITGITYNFNKIFHTSFTAVIFYRCSFCSKVYCCFTHRALKVLFLSWQRRQHKLSFSNRVLLFHHHIVTHISYLFYKTVYRCLFSIISNIELFRSKVYIGLFDPRHLFYSLLIRAAQEAQVIPFILTLAFHIFAIITSFIAHIPRWVSYVYFIPTS